MQYKLKKVSYPKVTETLNCHTSWHKCLLALLEKKWDIKNSDNVLSSVYEPEKN